MLRKSLVLFLAAAGLLLAAGGECFALRAELAVRQMAVIDDSVDTGGERVLIEYEMPDSLASALIIHAELRGQVEMTFQGDQRIAELQAVPILTQWDAGTVAWSYPWLTPDSGIDSTAILRFFVRRGAQPISVDITHVIRDWLEGRRDNCGLMLQTSSQLGGTFDLSLIPGRGTAVPFIRVWYVPRDE